MRANLIPNTDHAIVRMDKYLRDLSRAGFEIRARGPYDYRGSKGRLRFIRNWRQRSQARMLNGELRHTLWDDVMSYIVGGFLTAIAEKVKPLTAAARPQIKIVDPNQLTIGAADREIYRPFIQIIAQSSAPSL